jgi:subtilisin family serine protease
MKHPHDNPTAKRRAGDARQHREESLKLTFDTGIAVKQFSWITVSIAALAACAPATAPVVTAPEPISATAPAPVAPPPTAPVQQPPVVTTSGVRLAPRNWQLLDDSTDRYPGISLLRAQRELLAGKSPKQQVVVAVIDGGVDTAHAALRTRLWKNAKEIAGNGKDDDRNGHVDDVHGWNFIGGAGGKDVQYDTFELTRMFARCSGAPQTVTTRAMPAPDSATCSRVSADYAKKKAETNSTLDQMRSIAALMDRAVPILKQAAGTDSLTPERVAALPATTPQVVAARSLYMGLAQQGATPAALAEAVIEYGVQSQYGLNTAYDPRDIVGDDYANTSQRSYGNADVTGPDAKHGTHVAGIIAAVLQDTTGMEGIAPGALVMPVRAVPDGDERDKDIANAIRYAVDNGARVINMSFGKAYSPFKGAVDSAVKYADAHGVLMVVASGNDGASLDTASTFPTPYYTGGGRAANWIEVGASSWRGGDTLAVSFSNYSHDKVDVFAPGEDILSAVPGGGYERLSGTSMAAPVVTGLAALIMSYYPDLTVAQVRQIILDSATRYNRPALAPGERSQGMVPFASLSVTGGIVNAYNALRLAQDRSAATH